MFLVIEKRRTGELLFPEMSQVHV